MSTVIEKFEIEVPKINGYFYPGEEISGRIIILAHQRCKVEEFNLKFLGRAHVKFTEMAPKLPQRSSSFMSKVRSSLRFKPQTHIVLNEETLDYDKQSQDFTPEQDVYLPPDCIVINNFTFLIPTGENYPTTIEGKSGSIKYWFETYLKVSTVDQPYTDSIPIIIHNKSPLHTSLLANKPGFLSRYKKAGVFGIFSGKIGFKLRFPKLAWVPGESVEFIGEIQNSSRIANINLFRLSVIRKTVFKAKGRRHIESSVICSTDGPTLNKGVKKEYWSDDPSLIIPYGLQPTTGVENENSLIEFEYFIEAEMRILGEGESMRDICPIYIGSQN